MSLFSSCIPLLNDLVHHGLSPAAFVAKLDEADPAQRAEQLVEWATIFKFISDYAEKHHSVKLLDLWVSRYDDEDGNDATSTVTDWTTLTRRGDPVARSGNLPPLYDSISTARSLFKHSDVAHTLPEAGSARGGNSWMSGSPPAGGGVLGPVEERTSPARTGALAPLDKGAARALTPEALAAATALAQGHLGTRKSQIVDTPNGGSASSGGGGSSALQPKKRGSRRISRIGGGSNVGGGMSLGSNSADHPTHVPSQLATHNPFAKAASVTIWRQLPVPEQEKWMIALTAQLQRIQQAIDMTLLSTNMSVEDAINKLVQLAAENVSGRFTVYTVEYGTNLIQVFASNNKSISASRTFSCSVGFVGSAFQNGEMLRVLEDAASDERYDRSVDGDISSATAEVVSIPIRDPHGRVVGIFQGVGEALSDEDIVLLKQISICVAMALISELELRAHDKFTALTEARKREERAALKFQALVKISKVVSSELDLSALMQVLRRTSRQLLDADRCTLFLVDDESRELWTRLEDDKVIRIPLESGIAGHVAATGETVNLPEAHMDPRFNREGDRASGYHTRSMLVTPVRSSENHTEIIGVINVINKGGTGGDGVFTPEDEELLTIFSEQASVAIHNSQMYHKTTGMRDFLQSVLSSITHYVFTIGMNGYLVSTNRSLSGLIGAPQDLLPTLPYTDWLSPTHHYTLRDSIRKVLDEAESVFVSGYDIKNPRTGLSTKINFSAAPLRNAEKEQQGVLVIIDDGTGLQPLRRSVKGADDVVPTVPTPRGSEMGTPRAAQLAAAGDDTVSVPATIATEDIRTRRPSETDKPASASESPRQTT